MKDLIDNSLKLLAFNTVEAAPQKDAPFGIGNRDALNFVLGLAQKLGFESVNYEGFVGYAAIGDKDKEGFDILGHLDTVPFGDGWHFSPLGEMGEYKGQPALYGRGTLDDKVPMLACLFAVSELVKELGAPKKRIRLVFGCNEESGWGCMEHFQKVDKIAPLGFSPDADFPVVYYEKGVVHFKLTFDKPQRLESFACGERANVVPSYAKAVYNGKTYSANGISAHGSHPEQGDNAGVKLLALIGQKENDGLLCDIAEKLGDVYGKNCNLDRTDDEGQYLSLNVGIIQTQGDKLEITIDFRYPLTHTEESVREGLQKAFKSAQIEKTHSHHTLFVDKTSPLVQTLLAAYQKISGDCTSKPLAIGGGTYARNMPLGVGFGPVFGFEPMPIHCVDECITLNQLEKMYLIYKEAIKNLCF